MTRTLLLPALLGSLVACSAENGMFAADSPAEDGDVDMDVEDTASAPEDDSFAGSDPDLASLEGTLTVLDGNIVPEASAMTITLFSGSFSLCSAEIAIQSSELSVVDDPSVTASSWWTLTLAQFDADAAVDCEAPVPETLGLGAAIYDAQLAPAADSAGFEDDGSALYSALAQFGPGEAVYLFGVLGTQAQFDGVATDDPSVEVQDGTYTLSTLYLLPLSDVQ